MYFPYVFVYKSFFYWEVKPSRLGKILNFLCCKIFLPSLLCTRGVNFEKPAQLTIIE